MAPPVLKLNQSRTRWFRQLTAKSNRLFIIAFHICCLVLLSGFLVLVISTTYQENMIYNDLQSQRKEKLSSRSNEIRNAVLVAQGLRFLTIIMGFYGVWKQHSQGMILAFSVFIIVFAIIITVSGISIFVKYEKTSLPWIRELLKQEMEHMDSHDEESPFIRNIQKDKKCCGIFGYKDWEGFSYGVTSLRVPPSCCLPWTPLVNGAEAKYCGQNFLPEHPEAERFIYTKGCLFIITRSIMQLLRTLASVCLIWGVFDAVLGVLGIYVVMKE